MYRRLVLLFLALCHVNHLAIAARKAPSTATAPKAAQPSVPTLVIGYLHQPAAEPPLRPFYDPEPNLDGQQGARLGITDNNTTGQFTQQQFTLRELSVPVDGHPTEAFKTLLSEGIRHIIVDLPTAPLLDIASLPEARETLLLNVSNDDDRLRGPDSKPPLFHLFPSQAMRADALAQYLGKKRWQHWLILKGAAAHDQTDLDALRKSAKKFGHTVVAEQAWTHGFEDRRTPESEVPVLTQQDAHDVVVVIDEQRQFGDLVPYRTWLPRPVVGSAGLRPTGWDRTHEAWGALQLQNRFRDLSGRSMTEKDYSAWLAVRAIGEAATRTRSFDLGQIRSFMLSEAFSLAGFKGVPLSFRTWDHQLRQPILLASDRSLVAIAPIEGYLHPRNELDTLGTDAPESSCKF